MIKTLQTLFKNNNGICVSVDDQKYLVLKQNDDISIIENNLNNVSENQLIRIEDENI